MVMLIWCCALLLVGGWSLLAWGLHAVLAAGPGWLEALPGWLDRLPLAALIDPWWPGWQPFVQASAAVLQTVLGWLGGAAQVLVWVLWGLATAGTLALAAVLGWAVRRFAAPRQATAAAGSPTAA